MVDTNRMVLEHWVKVSEPQETETKGHIQAIAAHFPGDHTYDQWAHAGAPALVEFVTDSTTMVPATEQPSGKTHYTTHHNGFGGALVSQLESKGLHHVRLAAPDSSIVYAEGDPETVLAAAKSMDSFRGLGEVGKRPAVTRALAAAFSGAIADRAALIAQGPMDHAARVGDSANSVG